MLLPTLSTLSLTVIKSSLLQPWVPRTEDSFSSQETQQNHCFNPGAKDWGFLLESRDTTEHDVLERNSRSKSRGNSGKFLRGRKAGGSFHWIRVSMSNHEALRALTPCEYHRNHIFFCWVLEGRDEFLVLNSHGAQQSLDFFESSEFISDHVFTMHCWFLYIHCSFLTCGYCSYMLICNYIHLF